MFKCEIKKREREKQMNLFPKKKKRLTDIENKMYHNKGKIADR